MNKTLLIIFVFVFQLNLLQAQSDVYDKITNKTCECITQKDFTKIKKEDVQTEAGLCILSAYSEYENEIPKKEKIDFKDSKSLEKLGTQIGVKMATVCPNSLMILAGDVGKSDVAQSPENELKGYLKSVKTDTYHTLVVQDQNGKNNSVLWLTYFPGSDKLVENANAYSGKLITIKYRSEEVFYPSTNSYTTQKIATAISE